jgi:hypothetical protein
VHVFEWELLGSVAGGSWLRTPRGVAVDGRGRVLVAESDAGRIAVLDAEGVAQGTMGEPGTGPGQLMSPADVAVDADGQVLVADSGNHRVQVFSATGGTVRAIGSAGTAAGRFAEPRGLGVDGAGRLYVADTGNHRVQRLNASGAVDKGWGGDGIVGVTGAVLRDDTGFDRPADVAVHPGTGEVYVADGGNHRIQVFDGAGRYLRSHRGVYRPHAIAFAPSGDLWIAGEDPSTHYARADGRLRVLRHGDSLVSDHYTGELDDLGRSQGGVAVTAAGRVVASDTGAGRLVATDQSLTAPAWDLGVDDRGTSVTVSWQTDRPVTGRVRLGTTASDTGGRVVAETGQGSSHQVVVGGLTPGARWWFAVSYPDSLDGHERFTKPVPLRTGARPGQVLTLRLVVAALLYTDVRAGPGYTRMAAEDLAAARARWDTLAAFYWRNSHLRVWLDIDAIEVDRDVTADPLDPFAALQTDLVAAGRDAGDGYDGALVASPLIGWNGSTSGRVFDRPVFLTAWTTQGDSYAIHETNHALDWLYSQSGVDGYEFNHGIWAIPGAVGHDISVNGQITRNQPAAVLTAAEPPFGGPVEAPDADGDQVPDRSPVGLTRPFPVTEATLSSDTASADTDGDGLDDLREATALPAHATDPRSADSDGDGTRDGQDPNPAYPVSDTVAAASPTIDGVLGAGEGWTPVTSGWGFSNDGVVDDSNDLQHEVFTAAAWNDEALYLAARVPSGVPVRVDLDGAADSMFRGPANYVLEIPGSGGPAVRVNVGVPDLFRQIDDDGQWSEIFDTNEMFRAPYAGRPPRDHPGEGLGFPGRLVTESDLRFARTSAQRVDHWELAVPWSRVTQLTGGQGRLVALAVTAGRDRLFETDYPARLRLVGDPVAERPFVNGLSPRAGPVGTVVTVTGSHLAGATAVTVAGTSATFEVVSDTRLRAVVPPDAGTGVVTVTTPAGTGTGPVFTVTAGKRVLIEERFGSAASGLQAVAGGTWRVVRGRYQLTDPATAWTGNANVAVHSTPVRGDFLLRASVRAGATASPDDDVSVVFGYRNRRNYDYVSLAERNGVTTSGVFRVRAGRLQPLADITRPLAARTFATVTVQRTGATIRVAVGGTQVARTTDSTLPASGRVGFGTRDNPAAFDNLVVILPR